MGLIILEKEGVSRGGIDSLTYRQTNSLQRRQEDYALCLKNMGLICPDWEGKAVFWGESEGGMIAANLAAQTSNTAAVLLFGAGGGMKPREEVKWALKHCLESQGSSQEEVDEYIAFLDAQMDLIILDPAADREFLGNTYKWWASFLSAEEGANFLSQESLPICLVHGVEDVQIPVESADLAAEMLSKTNALTYLRLEGYGHDLDTAAVQDAAYSWLEVILLGDVPVNDILVAQAEFPAASSIEDAQADYVFSRGKKDKGESGGEAYGSARVDVDSEGNRKESIDVGVQHDFGNGVSLGASAGASQSTDSRGNTRAEVHAEVRGGVKY